MDTFVADCTSFLAYNQRFQNIRHTGRGFTVNGAAMRGCIHRLREAFYPDFDVRYVIKSKKRKRGSGEGRKLGKRVDEEIEKLAKGEKVKGLHAYSKNWLSAVIHWRWRPVGAQVMIYDEALQIATAIDCIYKDAKGRLVVIEIKTGFDGYADKSTHFMREPLAEVTNAPLNQHFLQLLVSCAILEKHYWGSPYRAYVVYLNERGVQRKKLPAWARRHQAAIYERLRTGALDKRRHDAIAAKRGS